MDLVDAGIHLQELNRAAQRIATNLFELERDPTVELLDVAELRGETSARWYEAIASRRRLFASNSALRAVLVRANEVATSRRGARARSEQLEILLRRPTIDVSDRARGLDERGLLSGSRVVVRRTPDELIEEMELEFLEVRTIVLAASTVWNEVVLRVRVARERCEELASLGTECPVDVKELAALRDELHDLGEVVLFDPLSVDRSRVDRVELVLAHADRDVADMRRVQERWPEELASAHALLNTLVIAIGERDEAVDVVMSRIVVTEPLNVVTSSAALDLALDAIESSVCVTGLGSAPGELIEWRRQVERDLVEVRCVTETCRLLMTERADLRARLDAYVAKAERQGLLEAAVAAALYEVARAALYTAPTDLAAASEDVRRFAEGLVQRPAGAS